MWVWIPFFFVFVDFDIVRLFILIQVRTSRYFLGKLSTRQGRYTDSVHLVYFNEN